MTAALKGALKVLGMVIVLGITQAYSPGGEKGFVFRPSMGPFAVDSAPLSTAQANGTADGVSEAPREEEDEESYAHILIEALTRAVDSRQNAEDAEILLGRSLEDINERDEYGLTPLIWAARDGDEARIRLLIKLGAGVNQGDLGGQTALHWAAQRGHEGVVGLLVQEFLE